MIISRFAYAVPVDDGIIALHHSLNFRTVFISDKLLDQISNPSFNNPLLEASGILIDSPDVDDDLQKSIKERVFNSPSAISVMYLLLTDECNLACEYCFIENQIPSAQKRVFLSALTAKKAVDFYVHAVHRHLDHFERRKSIIFYGGEPLLNKPAFTSAVEYINELKSAGKLPSSLRISLISNGTQFDEEIADFIAEHGVNVAISLDGNEAATNRHRFNHGGKPVFDRIIKSIRLLQDKSVPVGVSCTLNEETLRDPRTTIDFLINEIGVSGVGFNILYRGHSLSVPDDYEEKASSFILEAYESFREKGIFENRIMRKVDAFTEKRIYPYDCAAGGGRQIVVAPDGEVGICHGYVGTRKNFVGSVFDNSLIVEDTSTYKSWKMRSPLNMPECQDCIALGICGGGCPCDADTSKGSIWALDERFCIHAKMTLEWLIKDLWHKCIHSTANHRSAPKYGSAKHIHADKGLTDRQSNGPFV